MSTVRVPPLQLRITPCAAHLSKPCVKISLIGVAECNRSSQLIRREQTRRGVRFHRPRCVFFVVVCQSRDLCGGPRRSASSEAAFARPTCATLRRAATGPAACCRTTALHLDTQRESTDQQSAGRLFTFRNLKREELTDSSTGLFVPFEPFSPLSSPEPPSRKK